METPLLRPDIYNFHDYRAFLLSWLRFLKESVAQFSVRKLAKDSGVSESYLSMIISGERTLSEGQLAKLLPHLGLSQSEQMYLGWLRTVVESSDQEIRLEALKKIENFREDREMNPLEIETYHYLSNWHYVVIRELAALPDFKPDPRWIRSKLKTKVSLAQIRKGLDFLTAHGFIEVSDERYSRSQRSTKKILGKVASLKPALSRFYKEMLSLACDSIDNAANEEGDISAHTCAIPAEKVHEARRILEEARERIVQLTEAHPSPDTVYHFSFLAFPLTKR